MKIVIELETPENSPEELRAAARLLEELARLAEKRFEQIKRAGGTG
ncbi:MAG: hypothetical protein GSR80_000613 [Desulfurococcales archaeon]|nr:hypothetical protein [Desulfurococcales archaeon]